MIIKKCIFLMSMSLKFLRNPLLLVFNNLEIIALNWTLLTVRNSGTHRELWKGILWRCPFIEDFWETANKIMVVATVILYPAVIVNGYTTAGAKS